MRTVRISWPEGQKHPSLIEEIAGFAIQGIRRLTTSTGVDEHTSVDAEIWMQDVNIANVKADARFYMKNPIDGIIQEVSSIIFADGSKVDL